jgi:hypothetical protein
MRRPAKAFAPRPTTARAGPRGCRVDNATGQRIDLVPAFEAGMETYPVPRGCYIATYLQPLP